METRSEVGHSEVNVDIMQASSTQMGGHSNPVHGMVPCLEQPMMESGDPVAGATKNKHRKENKRKRIAKQLAQEPVDYWQHHRG